MIYSKNEKDAWMEWKFVHAGGVPIIASLAYHQRKATVCEATNSFFSYTPDDPETDCVIKRCRDLRGVLSKISHQFRHIL